VNPADDISLARIINYPPRGIGDSVVGEIQQWSRQKRMTMLDALADIIRTGNLTPRANRVLESFLKLLNEFRTAMTDSFNELVRKIITDIKLKERLEEEEKGDRSKAESKIANINSFISDVVRYTEMNPEGGVEGFLEEVALVTDIDQFDQTQEKVSLMTIHSAKGLEFPVVMIGGLEEGMLPLISANNLEDIEEERRLFFVGATRAKDWLVLGCAEQRMRWGSPLISKPSRFVKEIPGELLMGGWKRTTPPVSSSVRLARRPALARDEAEQTRGFDPDDLHIGLLVRHPTFGLGMVIGFKRNGLDSRIEVDFDQVGRKILILRYARLEPGN